MGIFAITPCFKAFSAWIGLKHYAYQLGMKCAKDDKNAIVAPNLGNHNTQVDVMS